MILACIYKLVKIVKPGIEKFIEMTLMKIDVYAFPQTLTAQFTCN